MLQFPAFYHEESFLPAVAAANASAQSPKETLNFLSINFLLGDLTRGQLLVSWAAEVYTNRVVPGQKLQL